MVCDVDSDICWAGFLRRSDRNSSACDSFTERSCFEQGCAVGKTSTGVPALALIQIEIANLIDTQVAEIVKMENIAALLSRPAEPDVGKRSLMTMRGDPESDYALVGLGHLMRPGKQAESVDDVSEAVGVGEFLRQEFRRKL